MTGNVSSAEESETEQAYQRPPVPHPVFPDQVASIAQPGLANVNPTYANATYNAAANYGAPTGQAVFVTTASSAQPMQPPTYTYVMAQQVQQPLSRAEQSASTCWFVVGILSAIFCCLPFGVVGAITAYLSKEDAEKGDAVGHRKRLCQAKGFTSAAIGVGLLAILSVAISLALIFTFGNIPNDLDGFGSVDKAQRWTDQGIYIGCYKDDLTNRDLDKLYKDFGYANSVSRCVKYCADNGYKYAGLQDETKCYCGSRYGSYGEAEDYECTAICSSDGNRCGGYKINAIYKTNYLGCFADNADRSLGEDFFIMPEKEATPETCVEYCAHQGYEFAGLQDSDKCYCGKDPNRYGETNAQNCNKRCPGDSNLICGGNLENSVYKTNLESTLNYGYRGCYEDKARDRDLADFYVNLGSENSVEKCVTICADNGYKYAGVQYTTECYCSQTYGRYLKKEDSECDMTCPNSWHSCGGSDRNQVYRTFYFGCFEDSWARALNESVYLGAGQVTPTACIAECQDKGYLFAGVQNGNECYCGLDANRYGEVPGYECSTPCDADSGSVCGGTFRNSVYRVDPAPRVVD